ncbi:MAG: CoA transferase [Chloroflexota bacterium]
MGPLEGIRVVELSTGIAGPIAGMLLADYGAEVVKVEPPSGDPARALPGFAVWNRNKRSVVVDGCTSEGQQRLAGLLAAADVCIFADRSALGSLLDEATASNPGLVQLHMPPYLPDGAPWAGGAESHMLLTGFGGASCRQASFDGGPIYLVYPVVFYEQGVWAAACAVAALVERLKSKLGQEVMVSGLHGVMACMPGSFSLDPAQPAMPTNIGPGGRHPCYSTFRCGDGEWLFMAALTPKFQANAFKVLGVGDIHADPRIAGQPSRLILPENRPWVRKLLADAFMTRSRDEWLELLELGDCPAGPMLDRNVWLDHPQVVENGLRAELDDPERGHVLMPGLCIGLEKTPGAVRTPAPRLGEHDGEVPSPPSPLSLTAGEGEHAAGATAAGAEASGAMAAGGAINRARTIGDTAADPVGAQFIAPSAIASDGGEGHGPLAGYKVLDLGTILAGPYAGNLLAGLGADVVKVESPAGDAFRETGFVYNRGMRGLAIDLSKPAGQQAFHKLVETADMVLDNSRQSVSKRLRFDYETLAQVNPAIITLSISGFGEKGPIAHKPAFDPVLQAMSGMMSAQGGDSDPGFFTIPINDVMAAVTSVLAVCLALYHRERGGGGQKTTTSLVASSLTMQSGELVRYEGRPSAILGGRDFAGPTPEEHFYRTADGWIGVQAPSVAALVEALGVPGTSNGSVAGNGAGDATAALSKTLAELPLEDALARLYEAGIPAAHARGPLEVSFDPSSAAVDLLTERPFPDGKPYLIPHRYARFSRTEQASICDAPGIGEHSRAVLAEAGVPAAEIDALVADRVIVEGKPFVLQALVNYR